MRVADGFIILAKVIIVQFLEFVGKTQILIADIERWVFQSLQFFIESVTVTPAGLIN